MVRFLPLAVGRACGRALGWSAYALLRGQRALALTHLQRALGETLSPKEQAAAVKRLFINLGQNAAEWMKLPALSPEWIQSVVSAEGVEHLQAAMAKGRGALVITAHFGNWELIAPFIHGLGYEGGVLARQLRYPEYEDALMAMRQAKGVETIARGGSLREIAKALKANKIIGLLPDQDVDSLDGVFVDVFGEY